MLHIINKSPFSSPALKECMRFITTQDAILLIEDGVYAAVKNNEFSTFLNSVITQTPVYALQEDIAARGITNKIMSIVKVINYDEFVDLTITHHPIQSWS